MTTAYIISFVLGLLGNGIGIFIVCRRSRRRFCSTNVLIGNMVLADLLVTLFAMPLAVEYLYIQNKWFGGLVGEMACKLINFPNFVTISASVLTILTISIERYCAVFYHLRNSFLRKSKYLTAIIWCTSIVLACPYLFSFTLAQDADGQYFCVVEWGDIKQTYASQRIYYSFVFVFLYAIPLALMTVLYTRVAIKLWKKSSTQSDSFMIRKSATKAKRKVVKLLLGLVVLFALCSAPAHIMHYYMFYELKAWLEMPLAIKLLSFWIYNTNSAINPIVYIVLNERFRREFFRLAHSHLCERRPIHLSTSKTRRIRMKPTVTTRVWLQVKKKERH